MQLRDYQEIALKKVIKLANGGRKSACVVMPPGSGKTVTGSYMSVAIGEILNGPILWVAHRKELIKQAKKTLNGLGHDVGIIAPWAKREPHKLIQVGSIQTLRAVGAIPHSACVVWDEAHHAMGADWKQLAKQATLMKAFLLGLTATPERADGQALDVFKYLIVAATQKQLISKGYLVPTNVFVPENVIHDGLADAPVVLWEKYSRDTKTIVFCESVEHSIEVAEEFKARGYRADYVEGNMNARQRDSVINRFIQNKIDIICNCQILTEGFDLPPVETTILARKVGSVSLYIQMTGRGSRPFPNKKESLCLDIVGNAYIWGLPDEDRKFSLTGKPICLKSSNDPDMIRCPNCSVLIKPKGTSRLVKSKTCPNCNMTLGRRKNLKIHKVGLKKLESEQQKAYERAMFDRWLDYANIHGKGERWAIDRFLLKFKKKPEVN